MPTGAFATIRPLAEIRRRLAGKSVIYCSTAATALGVSAECVMLWTDAGLLAASRPGKWRTYTAADIIEFAAVFHSSNGNRESRLAERLTPLGRGDDAARATVLRMMEAWHDCETVQELHDAAGIRPIPPREYQREYNTPTDSDANRAVAMECSACGVEFVRSARSESTRSTCPACSRRISRDVTEFVAWCRCRPR